jgi:hypothetical protein
MKTEPIKTIRNEIDGQNRQLIWTAYADGSAMSREITRHITHACSATETHREKHPAGSELATMIHAMPA